MLQDGRANNGKGAEIPVVEIESLRHTAATECGGRMNEAWRKHYSKLSEPTRIRYPDAFNCPSKIYDLVSREKVDALHALHHGGKRAVRKMIGGLTEIAGLAFPQCTHGQWTT